MNNKVIVSEDLIPFPPPALCVTYCCWKYWTSIVALPCVSPRFTASQHVMSTKKYTPIAQNTNLLSFTPKHTHTYRVLFFKPLWKLSAFCFLIIKISVWTFYAWKITNGNPCTKKNLTKKETNGESGGSVGDIHSEARGGRGDEEDEGRLQSTVGDNNETVSQHYNTFFRCVLCGYAAEEELFTA